MTGGMLSGIIGKEISCHMDPFTKTDFVSVEIDHEGDIYVLTMQKKTYESLDTSKSYIVCGEIKNYNNLISIGVKSIGENIYNKVVNEFFLDVFEVKTQKEEPDYKIDTIVSNKVIVSADRKDVKTTYLFLKTDYSVSFDVGDRLQIFDAKLSKYNDKIEIDACGKKIINVTKEYKTNEGQEEEIIF